MEDPIHRYFQAGITQWMSYPQGDLMGSLKAAYEDDFFDATELKGYGYKSEEAKRLLEQSHLKACYGAQPRLLGEKLNPNDLDEGDREKTEAALAEAIDGAEHLGAKGIAFLIGKWRPGIEEQAHVQLLKTTRAVRDYSAEKGAVVELEVFDYNMDKAALIGPTPYTAELAADMCTTHSNFGFLADLSHFPTTYKTSRFVTHTPRPYITRFHFGNAVVIKNYDGCGGLHLGFGYPNNANNTPQLLNYLKVVREKGFFDAENPYILFMEVTSRPGEDRDIILTNTKRVLKRAWTLLEDNT